MEVSSILLRSSWFVNLFHRVHNTPPPTIITTTTQTCMLHRADITQMWIQDESAGEVDEHNYKTNVGSNVTHHAEMSAITPTGSQEACPQRWLYSPELLVLMLVLILSMRCPPWAASLLFTPCTDAPCCCGW